MLSGVSRGGGGTAITVWAHIHVVVRGLCVEHHLLALDPSASQG